jgi:hypothetical protein
LVSSWPDLSFFLRAVDIRRIKPTKLAKKSVAITVVGSLMTLPI